MGRLGRWKFRDRSKKLSLQAIIVAKKRLQAFQALNRGGITIAGSKSIEGAELIRFDFLKLSDIDDVGQQKTVQRVIFIRLLVLINKMIVLLK